MTEKPADGMWFAPKALGFGAGAPIAWQGWALLAVHGGVIALGLHLLHRSPPAQAAWAVLFALLPLPLYAARTRGGWKWRWRRPD